MRIVFISDTHTKHRDLALIRGDVLVHCGDITFRGEYEKLRDFDEWVGKLDYKHKLVIAGNHDLTFESNPDEAKACLKNCTYLQDSEVIIDGIKFYGSPWQPEFNSWAFNLPRGEALKEVWSKIPNNADVLLTHGPAYGVNDQLLHGGLVGCEDLREAVLRVKPLIHAYGHIHEGYGVKTLGETMSVNASTCDIYYKTNNSPIVLDILTDDNGNKTVQLIKGGDKK